MSSDLAVNAVSVLLAGWVWSQLLKSALEVSPHAPSRRSWLKFLRGTLKQVGLPFLRSAKAPVQPPQDTEKAPEQQSTFPQSVDLAGADLPGFENESHVPQAQPATDRVLERVTRAAAEGSLKGPDSPGEAVVERDPEAQHVGCTAPEACEPEVAEEVTPAPQATLPPIEAAENTGARDAPPSLHEAVVGSLQEGPSTSSTAPPFRFSSVRVQPGDVCRVLGLLMDVQQPDVPTVRVVTSQPEAQQHLAVTEMDTALTGHMGAVGRSESGGKSSDPGEAPPEAKLPPTQEVDAGMQLQGDSTVEALEGDSDVQNQEDSGEVAPGAEAPEEPLSRPQAEAEGLSAPVAEAAGPATRGMEEEQVAGTGSIQTAPADARASWQAEGGQPDAAQLAQQDAPIGDQQALDPDRPQSASQSSTSVSSSSAANLVYRIPGKNSMYRPVKKNQTDGSLAALPVAPLPSEPADLRAPSDGSRTEGASATASLVVRPDPAEAAHPTISLAVSGRQDQKKKGVWQKKESSSSLLKEAEGVKSNSDSGSGQVSPVAVWQPTLFGGVANSTTPEAFQAPSSACSVSNVGELPAPRSDKPVQKSGRHLTEAWTQGQQPVSTAKWATRPGPQHSSTNDVASSNPPSERLPEKRQSARWADAWEESLEPQESEVPEPVRSAEPASRPQKVSKGWQPSLRPCQDE